MPMFQGCCQVCKTSARYGSSSVRRHMKQVNLSSELLADSLEELAKICNLKIEFGLSFYYKKKERTTFFSVYGLKSDIDKFKMLKNEKAN